MKAAPTHVGVYHAHQIRGRDLLVTIAFRQHEGERLVEELGPRPERFKKIAVVVGAVAETLEELLAPGPEPAEAFGFARAIVELADLAAKCAHYRRVADVATGDFMRQAAENRDRVVAELADASVRFDAAMAAALAGGGR